MEMLDASRKEISALLDRVETVDAHPGFSEYKEVRLGGAPDANAAAWGSGGHLQVVAVAVARRRAGGRHWSLEVAVDPQARTAAVERQGLARAAALVPDGDGHSVWIWREPQLRAAQALGYREVRRLLRMEVDLGRVPAAAVPPGVTIDPIDPATDIEGIIAVNNRAFAGHREAAAMDRASLDGQMNLPWYDARGFLVARSGERVAGFSWTKQHPERVGEIYVVAVDPAWKGRGLGRTLVTSGFASLAVRGARAGMVWVDEQNESAVELYRSLGMETTFVSRELEPGLVA
jgi:mycothiol synthase